MKVVVYGLLALLYLFLVGVRLLEAGIKGVSGGAQESLFEGITNPIAALAVLWLFGLQPYQRERILDVVDSGRAPLASGYQVNQSRIAVGSGGLFGKGYREGTQRQLRFLPTQHTDFAFSVLAEEWGFAGSVLVLGAYAMLLSWGLVIASKAKDGFGAMLAVGVVGMLFWPAVLNVGMVLGVLPVIGVPLPFISYGGSALVTNLIAVGLLMNVSLRRWVF